jgi:hypothetical protein
LKLVARTPKNNLISPTWVRIAESLSGPNWGTHFHPNWLIKALGKPDQYSSAEVLAAVTGRKCIIFFKDFWTRQGESTPQGDHIDLWDGSNTPYGEHQGTRGYFARSKVVWFWEIK